MKKALMVAAASVASPEVAQAQDVCVPIKGFHIGGGGLTWALELESGVTTNTGWLAGGKVGYDFLGPASILRSDTVG